MVRRQAYALGLGLSLLLAAPAAFAQQARPWEQIPTPALHEFHPHQPVRVELKNGIVLFLQEDHELPFVSGSVMIPGGSHEEPAAKIGLVDLYGQAWRTSGTAAHNGDLLDDLLEARAAHLETSGGLNTTSLSWDSLKADSDQVFDLAMELLFHPRFNAAKLGLAQQQMAASIVRRNDDANSIASREAEKLAYGAASPYARQEELATIGAVTLADLVRWHEHSLKGRMIVGVYGDFNASAMEAKLRAAFEKLPAAEKFPAPQEVFTDPKPGVYFIPKDDVNQSTVEMVALGTDRHNPDYPALAVMNEVLGGGFASRLFQKVRTELGLAYSVDGGYGASWDHTGTFSAEVLTKSASTVEATRATLDELYGLNKQPFTEEELKRAKDNILNSFLFRYDTRAKVLAGREQLEFYGYPADYLETYKAAIEKITVADLTTVAAKYIHPEKLAILVVGNASEIKPTLDELKLGPVKTIDISIPMPQPKTRGAK